MSGPALHWAHRRYPQLSSAGAALVAQWPVGGTTPAAPSPGPYALLADPGRYVLLPDSGRYAILPDPGRYAFLGDSQ